MPKLTDDEMDSRLRRAVAVGRVWEAVQGCTADRGEYTGWEWAWILSEVLARIIAIELGREGKG